MTITLEVVEGPGLGRKIFLQPGERATVGRTEESDFCFSDNDEMSSRHFELVCVWPRWFVHDLDSSNGTTLNGERITHAELNEGDQLVAGRDVFRITLIGRESALHEDATAVHGAGRAPPAETTADQTASAATAVPAAISPIAPVRDEAPGFVAATASEICQRIEDLDDAARDLLNNGQTPQQFLAALEENEQFTDAIRFLAHALSRRDAVDWAASCVRSASGNQLGKADASLLEVIDAWVADPSEENRRAAMVAAEAVEMKTPASWAAVGAFWSEGSMAPPDAPVIPPAPHLTAHAVTGSVTLSAVEKEPEKASEKYHNFIQLGIKKGELVSAP